jgi:hypothetical protein
MSNTLYRYVNQGDVVMCQTHQVTKQTPKGFWIVDLGDFRKRIFVLNSGRKRYAYPTKEEAQTSFLARKRRQLAILKSQIYHIELAVEAIKEGRLNDYSNSVYFE